jgi:hypothetical protein
MTFPLCVGGAKERAWRAVLASSFTAGLMFRKSPEAMQTPRSGTAKDFGLGDLGRSGRHTGGGGVGRGRGRGRGGGICVGRSLHFIECGRPRVVNDVISCVR